MTLISDNQAGQAQQILMRFYEELLRVQPATIDLKNEPEETEEPTQKKNDSQRQEKKQPKENIAKTSPIEVEIYQNNQLIYQASSGENQWRETLANPRILGQIEIIQSLRVGTVTPAQNLQVKVNERTVLSTDEQGKITQNILRSAQEKRVSGTEVIRQQLAQLNNSLERAKAEINYLNNIIQTQTQKPLDPNLAETAKARQQKPQEPNWWLKNPLGQQIRQQWQAQHQARQAARTIHWLFQKNVPKGGQVYHLGDYTILYQPEGKSDRYSLLDKQGNELMNFSINQTGNLSIESNRLNRQDCQAIQQLSQAARQAGTARPPANPRSQKLAEQLQKMAQQEGRPVRRSGEHYNLAVAPDGNLEISARDGRGVIFQQISQGGQHYIMSDRLTSQDLDFFEKQLQSPQAQRETARKLTQPGGHRR